jgi:transglutaminase-like putative cysteine protease
LLHFAWQKFGNISPVYDQVIAVTNWIHDNVQYISGATNASTSACDTVIECAGVCRDFAHLGVALCRALNIPSRYVTGYAFALEPPDFHACFEAFIGNKWILFDATRLAPLNGLVRIGHGRDAADVSLCTAFGFAATQMQTVNCEAMDENFKPFSVERTQTTAISYDSG